MPSIKLTDQFGLDVDVDTDLLSSLSKYAANLSKISLSNLNLKSLVDLSLANPTVTSLHTGLNFDQPVAIGSDAATLTVSAGVSGSLDIYVPSSDGGTLFDSDPYGEAIPVAAAERYVSLTLNASASADVGAAAGKLSFSFQPGASVSLASFRKFTTLPAAPPILDAVCEAIAHFCIPGSPDDLRSLAVGSVVTMEGAGTLAFSAQADLLAVTNPLATLALPSPLPSLDVSAGGSVTVAAACTVSWEYQMRIRKLDSGHVTLGFYRKRGSQTTVTVNASEGIGASIGGTELISSIVGAISKSAGTNAIQGMELPAAQLDAICDAVKNAAQRKLQIALLASLTMDESQGAAFLYEFDLSALDAAGTTALAGALRGNLVALTGPQLPAGVQMVRSIVTDLHKTSVTWKINLLGVYNFISTAELVRKGKILFEPATGDLTITDTATAQRIVADGVNFGADSDKLRYVLSESFLITAVYRGSKSLVAAPEIACSHSYFQLRESTGLDDMLQELTVATALGLSNGGRLAGVKDFGRTMVYAETSYSAAITGALFLNGADPKPVQEYDDAGRQAIRLLVGFTAPDSFRLRGVSDDGVWAKMCDAGQFNFAAIFPDLSALQVEVIAADYSTIVWWSKAMSDCAIKIAAMHAQLALNPDPQSPQFQRLRIDLAKKLADVTSDTREQFGQPWGLVAMDRVSHSCAAAKVQIVGARLTLARTRTEVRTGIAGTA